MVEVLGALGVTQSVTPGLPAAKQQAGHTMLKVALLMQIAVAAFFVCLAVAFHHRCLKHDIRNSKVTIPLTTLYASTALISVRTVYRIVEYWAVADVGSGEVRSPDSLSPVVRYEWFFYVLEATIMLANCALFNIIHPRRFLPLSYKAFLDKDGTTEVMGSGRDDNRPLIVTLCDPFDIAGALQPSKNLGKPSKSAGSQGQDNRILAGAV